MPQSERPPYFELWPRDFLCDPAVDAMTHEELGAYLLLLLRAWDQEQPGVLPDDDEYLSRMARMPLMRWQCVRMAVARAFEVKDGLWVQKRMVREAIKLCERIDKRAKAATKAAYARWIKNANAMRTQCVGHAISCPSTSESELIRGASAPLCASSVSRETAVSTGPDGQAAFLDTAPEPKAPKPRKPNPVWDAIVAEWGLSPTTKAEQKEVGLLARDFALKLNGQEPAVEIKARRASYRQEWPTAADTPRAVLKHWDRFGLHWRPQAKQAGKTVMTDEEVMAAANRGAEDARKRGLA